MTLHLRRGPYNSFKEGRYLGEKIEDVIKVDPMYVAKAIKAYLDVTEAQAQLFTKVTNGGEIPRKYIREDKKRKARIEVVSKVDDFEWPKNYTIEDIQVVKDNWFRLPNWDFDPEMAPPWYAEYKERTKKVTRPSIKKKIYEELLQREMDGYYKQHKDIREIVA